MQAVLCLLQQNSLKNFPAVPKRFAKSFYCKTPLLKTDASRFVSASEERFEKLSGSAETICVCFKQGRFTVKRLCKPFCVCFSKTV